VRTKRGITVGIVYKRKLFTASAVLEGCKLR